MHSGSTQARPMTDHPIDLDKHRGMAAGKETDLRRVLVELETKAKDLRDRQAYCRFPPLRGRRRLPRRAMS